MLSAKKKGNRDEAPRMPCNICPVNEKAFRLYACFGYCAVKGPIFRY